MKLISPGQKANIRALPGALEYRKFFRYLKPKSEHQVFSKRKRNAVFIKFLTALFPLSGQNKRYKKAGYEIPLLKSNN